MSTRVAIKKKKKQEIAKAGKEVRELKPLYIAGGILKQSSHLSTPPNSFTVPQKVKQNSHMTQQLYS